LNIGSGAVVSIGSAAAHSDRWVMTLRSLAINGGRLNLGGNDMIVHNDAVSTLFGQIQSGLANGAWNGLGITSTAAQNNTTHLTTPGLMANTTGWGAAVYSAFDNQPAIATDVLVKHTYLVDANRDGKVDASDYSMIDNAFNTPGASLAAEIADSAATGSGRLHQAVPRSTALFSEESAATLEADDPHKNWFSIHRLVIS